MTAIALAALLAGTIAAAVVHLIRRHAARLKLLDAPNERSSHRVTMPRGGGAGIVVGVGVTLLIMHRPGDSMQGVALFGAASAVACIGAIDDRRGVSAPLRLLIHTLAAALAVYCLGPVGALWLPGLPPFVLPTGVAVAATILWLVAVTNFFNFMDGIDGLAGGQAAASAVGVVLAAWSADAVVLAAAIAGASLGFLVHNWPPARIFMGDVGSGYLGFLLAGLPLLAPDAQRPNAVVAVATGLALFLLDPAITLVRRAFAGKNILRAHREHLYQRLAPAETSVVAVTTRYVAAALLLAGLGALGFLRPDLAWVGATVAIVAFGVVWVAARRRP